MHTYVQYYLDRIGGDGPPTHGRIHTRLNISCLIQDFCARDAYPRKTWPPPGKGGGEDPSHDDPEASPLVALDPERWEAYGLMIKNIKKDALRMDANAVVLPVVLREMTAVGNDGDDSDEDEEAKGRHNKIVRYNESLCDDRINQAQVSDPIFTRKYDEIAISMQFHEAMSGFRTKVEQALDAYDNGDDENDEITGVSSEEIAEFR